MNDKKLNILVIEDNQRAAANIGDYLKLKGHDVDFAMDGLTGMHLAVTQTFDVIILDIMLPGMDGLTLCKKLREEAKNYTPVLMLTAKDTLDDKVAGFDAGTDDYLLKPFEMKELEVRLHALVRRSKNHNGEILEIRDIRLDKEKRIVTKNKVPVELNRTCYTILVELMTAAPKVVTREELEKKLWDDYTPASDVLRTHIYALRKKIDTPGKDSIIETILGVGFKIKEK
ncbi:MAG: response regulator transcription factor [Desulfobacterales bacterium]|nr:response regulator transcription factor [Desulfobacterales bacterium]